MQGVLLFLIACAALSYMLHLKKLIFIIVGLFILVICFPNEIMHILNQW